MAKRSYIDPEEERPLLADDSQNSVAFDQYVEEKPTPVPPKSPLRKPLIPENLIAREQTPSVHVKSSGPKDSLHISSSSCVASDPADDTPANHLSPADQALFESSDLRDRFLDILSNDRNQGHKYIRLDDERTLEENLQKDSEMDRGDGIIRWSPNPDRSDFLNINVGYPFITLHKATGRAVPERFEYSTISKHDEYPTLMTAHDWSPRIRGLVAVGTKSGEVHLLRVDDDSNASIVLPLKLQRACQAVAFNTTGLLAVGLDRVRQGQCLQIWDIEQKLSGWEPSWKGWGSLPQNNDAKYNLEPSVAITSVRFFEDQPQTLVVGVKNQYVRIHDLRDPQGAVITFQTRCNNNLAIDHADPNYFASSALDHPGVMIWDRRTASRQSASQMYLDSVDNGEVPWGCALKLDQAIDSRSDSSIKSLRYCRDRRGLLGVLSSSGELQVFHTRREYCDPMDDVGDEKGPELLEVKKSHALEYAYFHENFQSSHNDRVVSFDWMTTKDPVSQPRVIIRRYNQDIGIKLLPTGVQNVLFDMLNIGSTQMKVDRLAMPEFSNPREGLSVYAPFATTLSGRELTFSSPSSESTANATQDSPQLEHNNSDEIMEGIYRKCYEKISWVLKPLETITEQVEEPSAASAAPKDEDEVGADVSPPPKPYPSSTDAHAKKVWAVSDHASAKLVYGVLSSQMIDRITQGYLFNSIRNQDILAADPWLQDVWAWVGDAKKAADDSAMVSGSLDLAYMGVSTIWNKDLGLNYKSRIRETSDGSSDEQTTGGKPTTVLPTAIEWNAAVQDINDRGGHSEFRGVRTDHAQYRRLCLTISGWGKSSAQLDADIKALGDKGLYTKAAIWALIDNMPEKAVGALRDGDKELIPFALALQLHLARGSGPAIDKASWDSVLESHPRVAADPHLRAIYTLISTGDWKLIANDRSLPLRERVGIAIQNFPDTEFTKWLKSELETAIDLGDVEAIVLTGVTDQMVDIFCAFIQRYGDFQTAVLVMSFGAPRYVNDYRFTQWRSEYKAFHNKNRKFIQRAHFDVQSTKLSRLPDGTTAIKPPQRQITIRCLHCNTSIVNDHANTANPPATAVSSQQIPGHNPDARNPLYLSGINAGISCPKCGRHLPRCALCLQTLGMLRTDKQDPNATKEDLMGQFMSFCMKCDHAMHADHASQWFSRHNECPVASCKCNCNADNARIRKENAVRDQMEALRLQKREDDTK